MLLYAITDRSLLPDNDLGAPSFDAGEASEEGWEIAALVTLAEQWATRHIDYIQIREKDLTPEVLFTLTQKIVSAVRLESRHTRVLLNGPASIALEAGADGIHLPANSPMSAAADARSLFASAGRDAILSHACHTREEVLQIREESQRNPYATIENTLILYAPVFEKTLSDAESSGQYAKLPGSGLDALKTAVDTARPIPVLALGGVTAENAPACIAAGAVGIAGIRLFLKPADSLTG